MRSLFNNPWDDKKEGVQQDNEIKPAKESPQDLSLENILDAFGLKIKRQSGSGGNNPKKSGADNGFFIKVLAAISLLFWLSSGFYVVNQDEEAVVMRFGKYSSTNGPGLRWKFPNPIDSVTKVSVTRFNKVFIGMKGQTGSSAVSDVRGEISNAKESQMLTFDENIIDLHFFFQWRIVNAYDYLFNIRDVVDESTVKLAAESAMREVIGITKLYDALSEQRQAVEVAAKEILQKTLDSYGAGIEIVSLGILYSYVAPEVRDAYRDVQSAKADKETAINKAQEYRNAVMPKARGEASAIVERALSYKAARIADAHGEARKFKAIADQYKKNKKVVKDKIYLEALEEVYSKVNKIVIESGKGGNAGVLPILDPKALGSFGASESITKVMPKYEGVEYRDGSASASNSRS